MIHVSMENGNTVITFHKKTGLPVRLDNKGTGRNYLAADKQPFFNITLLNRDGSKSKYTALDAATAFMKAGEKETIIYYNFLGQRNLSVRCTVKPGSQTDLEFDIELRNESGCKIIDVEYPILLMPEEIEGKEHDWVLWHHPFYNGIITHEFNNLLTGPPWFMESSFASPIQMSACGTSTDSLYYCTMDTGTYSRDLQPIWTGLNMKMSSIHYIDEEDHSRFRLPYSAGVSMLDSGEWYTSAEKYRDWAEQQAWCSQKLWEKDSVPDWWMESPVVLAIKERGIRNKEIGQTPSAWCHPLVNGVDRIMELAQKFDSKLNVQVFHWEKGGGFLNGDHFPPLSGYEGTEAFFDKLHQKGHYGGVYILPSKWCLHAETTDFDSSEYFFEHDALGSVCCDEHMNPIHSNYDWEWRKRYMICATTSEGRSEIVDAYQVFSDLGADYVQWDTFNGRLLHCWNENHNHYPGKGRWQRDIANSIMEEVRDINRSLVVTVESQPNENIIHNVHGFVERGVHPKDEKGWETVPLYQYIYHQYVQGFAGEECGAFTTPDNFFLMNAITIVAGDMMMISLGMTGQVVQITHELHTYDQSVESVYPAELIEAFVRDMNRLRRDYAREFLVTGRMEKPPVIECGIGKILKAEFHNLNMPAVLGSSWTSPTGTKGTVLVNYTAQEQEIQVTLRYGVGDQLSITDSQGNHWVQHVENNQFTSKIRPYEAWVVKDF